MSIPGPAPLPTCDYCGDDFLDLMRGYKPGCLRHDPFVSERNRRERLKEHYAIARAVIRRSRGADVEMALIALDDLYTEALR